jgi:tetratricopeptide (TPR) repeat protein
MSAQVNPNDNEFRGDQRVVIEETEEQVDPKAEFVSAERRAELIDEGDIVAEVERERGENQSKGRGRKAVAGVVFLVLIAAGAIGAWYVIGRGGKRQARVPVNRSSKASAVESEEALTKQAIELTNSAGPGITLSDGSVIRPTMPSPSPMAAPNSDSNVPVTQLPMSNGELSSTVNSAKPLNAKETEEKREEDQGTVSSGANGRNQERSVRISEDLKAQDVKAQHPNRTGDREASVAEVGKDAGGVAMPTFGSMLPVRTLGVLYTLRSGGLARFELTSDVKGKGWAMPRGQISGAQEFARDLLTECVTLFESLNQQDKSAEAMGDLALCYWRSGAQDEGRALFRQAIDAAQKPETKLRTLTNASTVEISSGRYGDALALLNGAAALLGKVSDDWTHGAYHYQRGLVYRGLGGTENLDHALVEYSAASMHLADAGHIRHLAGVENNIGFIHMLLGRATEALTHLDRARGIFVSLKDSRMVAQVNDTRARVFLAEKRFADAERAIFAAIATFEKGEDSSLLAEALTTEGSIFARSGKYDSAREAFNRASEIAAAAGDSHLAAVAQLRLIEDLRSVLDRTELLAAYRRADQYVGERASQSDLEGLRLCGDIVIDKLEKVRSVDNELIGGTLEEEVNYFEAQLIARALERHNGSVTPAARELGLTHQGLSGIIDGRQSKILAAARRPKRDRRKSIMPR